MDKTVKEALEGMAKEAEVERAVLCMKSTGHALAMLAYTIELDAGLTQTCTEQALLAIAKLREALEAVKS